MRRAWNQVPPVQATVVTVNTIPVSTAGVPRHVWRSSGMNASPEKNANVIDAAEQDRGRDAEPQRQGPGRRQPAVGRQQQAAADQHAADDQRQRLGGQARDEQARPTRREQRVREAADRRVRGLVLGLGHRGVDAPEGRDGEAARDDEEREEAEEHPAPAEQLADHGRDRRPDDPGHDPRRAEHREHPRLEVLGQDAADRHVRRRPDRPATEPLDEPREDEDQHRRREAADEQPGAEQHEARGERPVERHPVQRAAGEHDAQQVAQEERRVDPAVELAVAELVGDDRHDRADGQRLERDEGDRRDQADRQPAQLGGEQVGGPGRACRVHVGCGGHRPMMPEGFGTGLGQMSRVSRGDAPSRARGPVTSPRAAPRRGRACRRRRA